MKTKYWLTAIIFLAATFGVLFPAPVYAEFRIVIMQEKKGSAAKYRPLLDYLKNSGIEASFVAARSYPHAAELFTTGSVDGMFSGSGIAGCMIIKDLAYPIYCSSDKYRRVEHLLGGCNRTKRVQSLYTECRLF